MGQIGQFGYRQLYSVICFIYIYNKSNPVFMTRYHAASKKNAQGPGYTKFIAKIQC